MLKFVTPETTMLVISDHWKKKKHFTRRNSQDSEIGIVPTWGSVHCYCTSTKV